MRSSLFNSPSSISSGRQKKVERKTNLIWPMNHLLLSLSGDIKAFFFMIMSRSCTEHFFPSLSFNDSVSLWHGNIPHFLCSLSPYSSLFAEEKEKKPVSSINLSSNQRPIRIEQFAFLLASSRCPKLFAILGLGIIIQTKRHIQIDRLFASPKVDRSIKPVCQWLNTHRHCLRLGVTEIIKAMTTNKRNLTFV